MILYRSFKYNCTLILHLLFKGAFELLFQMKWKTENTEYIKMMPSRSYFLK